MTQTCMVGGKTWNVRSFSLVGTDLGRSSALHDRVLIVVFVSRRNSQADENYAELNACRFLAVKIILTN